MTIKKNKVRKINKNKKNKKNKKVKQKGGAPGTDGSIVVLFEDIYGIVNQTKSTIEETVNLVDYVSNLDTNLNVPYSKTETNAPGANLS